MIRPRKIFAVASFEFLSTVKRKAYIIVTLGMPVFVMLYVGLIFGIGFFTTAKSQAKQRVYGLVDQAQILALQADATAPLPLPREARALLEATGQKDALDKAISQGNAIFRPFPGEPEARKALESRLISGYYVIAADYLKTGRVDSYRRGDENVLSETGGARQLEHLLTQKLLAGRVPDDIAQLIRDPIRGGSAWTIDAQGQQAESTGKSQAAKIAAPIFMMFLMMISLSASGGYLMQAVATEKENKVFEVLLSSAEPDEILAGKLLGLGGAGLLQVVVWFSMAIIGGTATLAALTMAGVTLPWLALTLGVVYFVLGYLLIGSLMIGTASLGNTMRESQQLSMVWTLAPILPPALLLQSILTEPHGTVARVLTFIPITAPLTVVIRLAAEPSGVAWWELAATLALLLVSIWVAIKIGARLFRVGVLLTGARPKLRQILRQAGLTPRWGRARAS